jgi:hypothetical protein
VRILTTIPRTANSPFNYIYKRNPIVWIATFKRYSCIEKLTGVHLVNHHHHQLLSWGRPDSVCMVKTWLTFNGNWRSDFKHNIHTECGIRLHGQLGIHSFIHAFVRRIHETEIQPAIPPFRQPASHQGRKPINNLVSPVSHYQSSNKDKWRYLYEYNSPDSVR